jgi:hypothetical protein
MQSYYVDKKKEKEKMYDAFRVCGAWDGGEMEVEMQGPVLCEGAFKRQTLDETGTLQFLYRPAWIYALLDVSFTLIRLFFYLNWTNNC